MSLAGTAITGTGKARFAKGFNYGAQGGCEGDICGVNEFARNRKKNVQNYLTKTGSGKIFLAAFDVFFATPFLEKVAE